MAAAPRRAGRALLLALAATALPALAEAPQLYRLESAVSFPGAVNGWDYLTFEPGRGYLYMGRRDAGVTVYDTRAGKVVGGIENSAGANAARLVEEFDRGYTVNEDGSTTVFQISTLKTLDRIKLGDDADNAFYDPVTRQLAFMMGDSKQIAFVDARTGALLGKLKMESEKLESSVPDGQGRLLVAERDRNRVALVDMKQRKLIVEWPTTGCEQPTGMAIDPAARRLFIGCRGSKPVLEVLDAETGKVVVSPEIGRGNDGVVYDAGTHRVYASNGVDANVVIYDQLGPDVYKLEEAFTTRPQARTMALDPASQKLFLVAAEGVVDPAQKANRGPAAFYPNRYYADTFTLLTYSRR
jgi:DNA-binding beta-propeller fold protein YncE